MTLECFMVQQIIMEQKNIKEIRNIDPKIDHVIIYPYCRVVVPTGIKLELPKRYRI